MRIYIICKNLLINTLLCCSLSLLAQGQQFHPIVHFKNSTIENGLSNNEVRQITQDKYGFVWLATGSGLNRFDGYEATLFRPRLRCNYPLEQLTYRPVRLFVGDGEHWLIGSDYHGLQVYEPSRDTLFLISTQNSALPHDAILNILPDGKNGAWLATLKGVCHFDFGTRSIVPVKSSATSVEAMATDREGRLWLWEDGFGLKRVDAAHYLALAETTVRVSTIGHVSHMAFDRAGNLWLAANNGIYIFDISKKSYKKFEAFGDAGHTAFSSLLFDTNGNLWAGSYNEGLFFFHTHDGTYAHFTHDVANPTSLISNKVACLFEDKLKNIWIGTLGEGISIINSDFSKFKIHRQLPNAPVTIGSNDVKSMATAPDGTIWLALATGIGRIAPEGGSPVFYPLSEAQLCGAPLRQLAPDGAGGLFLATGCGLRRWSPKEPHNLNSFLPSSSALPQHDITSFHYDPPLLYIGTRSHDEQQQGTWAYDVQTGHAQRFAEMPHRTSSVQGNQATRIYIDQKGRLWIGTYEGMNQHLGGNDFRRVQDHFAPNCWRGGNTIGGSAQDRAGNIWFGKIDEGGLVVFDPQTTRCACFGTENGLPNNSPTAILRDARGDMWLGSYLGVARIRYPDNIWNAPNLEVEHFTTRDGLPSNTIWNGAASLDGKRLYFGTENGLVELHPLDIAPDTSLADVQFTQFSLFNKAVAAGDATGILKEDIHRTAQITLRHDQSVFTLEFALLDYFDIDLDRFAYRLSSVNEDWVESAHRSVTYAQLPAGNYVFSIKAKGKNGKWTMPKTLLINILPPFWQRWWFMAACAFAIVLLVYAAHRYRMSQVLRMQKMRNQIAADLHDDIGTTLSNIEILGFLGIKQERPQTDTAQFLEKIAQQAKQSNQALHDIVWSINPRNDDLQNLAAYLVRFALECLEPLGVAVAVDSAVGVSPMLRVGAEKRKDIFLCFKECVTNICKYANASNVYININYNNKKLMINIKDNGIGLAEGALEKGNGLHNIKKRLEKWGGNATFLNAQGGGLEVQLSLPIP
jgi:ligand-binding sensor domain-containing protein/signal transduction histidine kinase